MLLKSLPSLLVTLIIACVTTAPVSATELKPGQLEFDRGHYANALNIWHPLATAGDPEYQVLIGEMYRRGLGVEKDQFRALSWHQKASAQGHADGTYHVAQFHLYGQGGVNRDPVRALAIFQSAADLGHWKAQYVISRAFATGEHVKQNYVEALKWLEISIASSKGEFGRKVFYRRRGLAKHMTESEIELGKKLAADWLAAHR